MKWSSLKTAAVLFGVILGMALPSGVWSADIGLSYVGDAGRLLTSDMGLDNPFAYNLPEGSLINDGSFESGPPPSSAWTESSVPAAYGYSSMILDVTDAPAIFDGSWCFVAGHAGAILGAGVMVSNHVEQSIDISNSDLFLKLRVAYHRNVDDPADPDAFNVSINGTTVFSKEIDMDSITFPDYVKEVIDISAYAGQTVSLRLEGYNGGLQTGLALVDYLTTDETFEQPVAYTSKIGASVNNGTDLCYTADDFGFAERRRITALWTGGGGVGNPTNSLADAVALNFAIYADAGGMPDGNPSGGGNAPVWSLSLAPSDAQISLTTSANNGHMGDVTLTLDNPVTLAPGTYWLVFYPTLNPGESFFRHASDTAFENSAMAISPNGSFMVPATWTAVDAPPIGANFNAMAFALQTEVVADSGGGGGGGGGCFMSILFK